MLTQLLDDLQDYGPEKVEWQNYSKLGKDEYHCHLSYHWVAAGENNKIFWYWRSIMLVHVKTPHTEIEIKGDVSDKILEVLQSEYGDILEIHKEEYINPFETDWYNEVKETLTPGDYLKTDRQNRGITQNELGSIIGNFSRQYISDMEHGRKNISLSVAKKLALYFNRPVNRYI